MSATEEHQSAWLRLVAAAVIDHIPADIFDIEGARRDGDAWEVRLDQDTKTLFRASNDLVGQLASELVGDCGGHLGELIGRDAIEEEIVRRAARKAVEESRGLRQGLDWATLREDIRRALTTAVVVVPVGGAYSSFADSDGNGSPIELGQSAIAGHLDRGMAEAIAGFAQQAGLAGFRFTNDAWWTEDLLDAQEDPQIGVELLEEIVERGSWPWLVVGWSLPASGPAAASGAITATESLMGAITLLDHPPGSFWGNTVPWIPGTLALVKNPREPAAVTTDNQLPIQPQLVDGRHQRLDNAISEIDGRIPADIDLAAHAGGPAGPLVATLIDGACAPGDVGHIQGARVAAACRLAWHAIAASSSDVRTTLAAHALKQLRAARQIEAVSGSEWQQLIAEGGAWRALEHSNWPGTGSLGADDFDPQSWIDATLANDELDAMLQDVDDSRLPWGASAAISAHRALHSLQACLFGFAARL